MSNDAFRISCNNYEFRCSPKAWRNICIQLIEATIHYVYELVPNEDNFINLTRLKKYLESGAEFAYRNIDIIEFMNLLNYFGLGGLYALCHQNNDSGYYTPGNSYDICELFNTVLNDCIKEEYALYKERIMPIFVCSNNNNCPVFICQ